MSNLPNQFLFCDIESTHKIVSCAEILTMAMIKTDLNLNVIDRCSWRMRPKLWTEEHDKASIEAHKITRDEAMQYPDKKKTLRDVWKWLGNDRYYFSGHFNRDVFGMYVSYDYALLKQEFFDQSYDAYFMFGQKCDRKHILSTHTLAWHADQAGYITVPLTLKEGNKKASKDFGLKNICRVMGMPFDESQHHGAEYDIEMTYQMAKKLSDKMNLFEVIKNDWRNENEQSNYSGESGAGLGIEIHELWNCSSEFLSSDDKEME